MMNIYIVLLRGINVGGKNIVPMADLRKCLEEVGFTNVSTYIASGNVIATSDKSASQVEAQIEVALVENFKLDSAIIKVLALSHKQLKAIVNHKPDGFGEHPERYHSDAIFLMNIDATQAMKVFNPREGVDKIWQGEGVIYSQRLSAERTRSRLSKIMSSPLYKSMTVRNWNTTIKLLDMLNDANVNKKSLQ